MWINKVCTISELSVELKPEERMLVNSLLDLANDLANSKDEDVAFVFYDLMIELAETGKFKS